MPRLLSTLVFPILGLRLRGDLDDGHLEVVQAEAGAEAGAADTEAGTADTSPVPAA